MEDIYYIYYTFYILYITLSVGNLKGTVPNATRLVHQRMNANGFYCHMIYSPETTINGKMSDCEYTNTVNIYIQNNDHSQYYVLCA
jgi:hypothetical protein